MMIITCIAVAATPVTVWVGSIIFLLIGCHALVIILLIVLTAAPYGIIAVLLLCIKRKDKQMDAFMKAPDTHEKLNRLCEMVSLLCEKKEEPHPKWKEMENIRSKLVCKADVVKKIKSIRTKDRKEFHEKLHHLLCNPIGNDNWQELEAAIDEAYNNYTSRLRLHFPALNRSDMLLIYLIILDCDNTEIVHLLGKDSGSIRSGKWRAKKKLNLTVDDDLAEFLKTF